MVVIASRASVCIFQQSNCWIFIQRGNSSSLLKFASPLFYNKMKLKRKSRYLNLNMFIERVSLNKLPEIVTCPFNCINRYAFRVVRESRLSSLLHRQNVHYRLRQLQPRLHLITSGELTSRRKLHFILWMIYSCCLSVANDE